MKSAWPVLLFGGLALLFPLWFGSALVADLMMRGEELRVEAGAEVKRASCRTFFFMVTSCRVTVVEPGRTERDLYYAMSGPVRPARLTVSGSRSSPDYRTTSLGREYLVNRSITFAAWMAVLLLLTWGGVRYYRYHRDRRGQL